MNFQIERFFNPLQQLSACISAQAQAWKVVLHHVLSIACAAGFVLFALPVDALGQSGPSRPVLERSFLVDAEGTLTIEQASQSVFTPYASATLNRGYTSSVSWIRVRLQPSSRHEEPLLLRIEPHPLDQIDLYELTVAGWVNTSAGDQRPYSQQRGGEAFSFLIQPHKDSKNEYYFRVKTTSLSYFVINAYSVAEANQSDKDRLLVFGIQLGILLFILGWSIVGYLLLRDVIFGVFSAYVIFVTLFNLSIEGVLARFLFANQPRWDDLLLSYIICLRLAAGVFLHWKIIQRYQPPKWYIKMTWVIYFLCFTGCFAISIGFISITLQVIMMLAFLSPLVYLYVLFKTENKLPLSLKMLFGFNYITLIITAIAINLPSISPISNDVNLISIIGPIGLINAIVLFIISWMINKIDQNSIKKKELDLIVLQVESKISRGQLAERSTLIYMLVHEIKNPLATIIMAVGSLKKSLVREQSNEYQRIENIRKAANNINIIIERCALTDQLDHNNLRPSVVTTEVKIWLDKYLASNNYPARLIVEVENNLTLETDAHLLLVVLGNLIENALKYSDPQVEVRVSAKTVGNHRVQITTANPVGQSGKPDEKKIFERYYRNSLAQGISGTGLGLYLCKSICSILGGSIHYEARSDHVIFIVELPKIMNKI